MATIAEQLTSLANTKTAIKDAIVAKGVTVADDTPFSGYAAKIGEISGGGGAPATKFGAGLDGWVGVLDENGWLQQASENFELDLSQLKYLYAGVQRFDMYAWGYLFYNNPRLVGTIDLSNFEGATTRTNAVNFYGFLFYYAFAYTGVSKVILPKKWNNKVQYAKMEGTFSGCALELVEFNLETAGVNYGSPRYIKTFSDCVISKIKGLERIKEVQNYGFNGTFYNATLPEVLYFDCLDTVTGDNAFSQTFYKAKGMTKIYFSSLISGNLVFTTFQSNTVVAEIHFRTDAQAAIEGLSGYSSKFGATNATIYFDLIGTITVNGVAYARDEKQSIRVDRVKTFVAWKDANDNVVYTSYENNAEPAVGTVVYSDAGTTQVGIVEGVA